MSEQELPLMRKATAVWLVENTSLTFEQIAKFCGLHPLEIRGIADGDVAAGIIGQDPITSNQLTREEIERCQKNPKADLFLNRSVALDLKAKSKVKKTGKYTPIARRGEKNLRSEFGVIDVLIPMVIERHIIGIEVKCLK